MVAFSLAVKSAQLTRLLLVAGELQLHCGAEQSTDSNTYSQSIQAVKLQPQSQMQSKRGLQAVLSQSFQPGTPGQPHVDHELLHNDSSTSVYSTGSGLGGDVQIKDIDVTDVPQAEPIHAQSEKPVRSEQHGSVPTSPHANTEDVVDAADMLPEHSLAAQMTFEASPPPHNDALLDTGDANTEQLPPVLTKHDSGIGRAILWQAMYNMFHSFYKHQAPQAYSYSANGWSIRF